MQSPAFNELYAKEVVGEAVVTAAAAQGPAAVLDLVSDDEYSFASASWFLATQCTPEVRQQLATGSVEGWKNYLTNCVGTTDTEERDVVWRATVAAMGQ
jgi:hypothetical protein